MPWVYISCRRANWGWERTFPQREAGFWALKWKKVKVLVVQSCLTLCDPVDYIVCQASMSIEFSRQEYWIGFPFPSPGISQPRDWTWVSCISCRFFIVWANKEDTNLSSNWSDYKAWLVNPYIYSWQIGFQMWRVCVGLLYTAELAGSLS